MKKKDRVKSNILFNKVINSGKHINSKYFVICSLQKEDEQNKYGIAVGTKVGNAVTRNKIKRQMRVIIDENRDFFPNFHNYVVICKKEVLNLSFQEMKDELLKLIKKENNNEK